MELFFIVSIHQLLIQLGTLFRLFKKKKRLGAMLSHVVGVDHIIINKINLCCSS
jgi:hypothetical protein